MSQSPTKECIIDEDMIDKDLTDFLELVEEFYRDVLPQKVISQRMIQCGMFLMLADILCDFNKDPTIHNKLDSSLSAVGSLMNLTVNELRDTVELLVDDDEEEVKLPERDVKRTRVIN